MRSIDDIFAEAAALDLHINSLYENDRRRFRASFWGRDGKGRFTCQQVAGSSLAEALEAALEAAKEVMPKAQAPTKPLTQMAPSVLEMFE